MSNKKQTAVDWLLQQFDGEKTPRQWEEVFKQAKELEKQQIVNSFYSGFHKGYNVGQDDAQSHPLALTIADNIHKDFEQYYKETYEQ